MTFLKVPSSGDSLLKLWKTLENKPLGKHLFSRILSTAIPYTGSIFPYVLKLEKGHSEISICDTKKLRNHLNCVHAIALANVGELSTGLAVTTQMPENMRCILKNIEVEYLKKARGTLLATSATSEILPSTNEDRVVIGEIFDQNKTLVTRVKATWAIGPVKK